MNLNLKNKVIIVTGGSKGIGFGICMGLIKEGAIPHIVGRKINDIKSAIKVLNANNNNSACSTKNTIALAVFSTATARPFPNFSAN